MVDCSPGRGARQDDTGKSAAVIAAAPALLGRGQTRTPARLPAPGLVFPCPVETPAMRVLLVEDPAPLTRALRQGLEDERFAVDRAAGADEADAKARGIA